MINIIQQLLSFAISWALVLLCFWGLFAFFPRKSQRGQSGPSWLILAIWLGFLGNGLNAFYWRVWGDISVYLGLQTMNDVVHYGQGYGDTVWKGLALVSVYMHFYARWKALPPDEQHRWSPLLIGFYPNDGHWAYRMLMWRRNKDRTDGGLPADNTDDENERA